MPQAKKKTPFSGKAKKQQLQARKNSKNFGSSSSSSNYLVRNTDYYENEAIRDLNVKRAKLNRGQPNRYVLKFHRETEAELRERKEAAGHSLQKFNEKSLEINGHDVFPDDLAFPVRPSWNFNMSRNELEARENKYFTEYIASIENIYEWKDLSYFELNLETWRQLWRVLEMSDILLVIVDIRFPNMMFPPSLYNYVVNVLKKNMILVLNKIDLCPAPLVAAWKHYFCELYPTLKVVYFTSCPGYNLRGSQQNKTGLLVRRRKGKLRMTAEGAQQLYEACREIVADQIDISSWKNKIRDEMEAEYDEESDGIIIGEKIDLKNDTTYYDHVRYKDGVLTIGCIGQPNVGKSSLMNSIMGKKVVSVSKTPGHTKHFQTIFLTPHVRLCDCPGLVFPSKVPKSVQILMGSYPIAQLREPYSAIRYLAERLDLPKLLRISHPENDTEWSAMDVCDGWAKKRGYLTAKTARLDSYRGANSILRMALEGRICLCLRPPGYGDKEEYWQHVEEVEHISWVQAMVKDDQKTSMVDLSSDDSDNEGSAAGGDCQDDSDSPDSTSSESEEFVSSAVLNKFSALQTIEN